MELLYILSQLLGEANVVWICDILTKVSIEINTFFLKEWHALASVAISISVSFENSTLYPEIKYPEIKRSKFLLKI